MQKETQAIRIQSESTQNREHSSAMYLTSSFTFEDAEQMRAAFASEIDINIYSRFVNPNTDEFVQKMVALEGAEAGYATASGMSSMFASIVAVVGAGDHIVASRSIFGSTHTMITKILTRFGITHTYVDANSKEEQWEDAIQKNTKMIF